MNSQQHSKSQRGNIFTLASYNIENMYDIYDDPNTIDDSFTPFGKHQWNKRRYSRKLKKVNRILSQIGKDRSPFPPVLIALIEVENKRVLDDLVMANKNSLNNFDIIHYDSPDERGIDVALLYSKTHFKVLESEPIPLILEEAGQRDYTRDILYVKGLLNEEMLHLYINHWPSRKPNGDNNRSKRWQAANRLSEHLNKTTENHADAKIVVMGDFNDDPKDPSMQHILKQGFFNPMQRLHDRGQGTVNHKGKWHCFDQILFSESFLESKKHQHVFLGSEIFNRKSLKTWFGKFKGNPFRTYSGKKYLGGISDHFPVYAHLKQNP